MRTIRTEVDMQRNLGFEGDPEVEPARYPDPEVTPENLEEMFVEKIKEISGTFMLYEGGLDAELDKWLTYKDLPGGKEVADAIGFEYDDAEEFLEAVAPELLEEWRENEDQYYGLDAFLEDRGGDAGFMYQGADNTYNWSYLGPFDVNFTTFEKDGTYYIIYRVHLGGDIRGNYSRDYIFEDTYESGFLEAISGSASVYFEFEDGSTWRFFSQQDSDVFYFEMDEYPDHNTLAAQFYPLIDGLSGYDMDEKIADLWQAWEDK